MPAERALWLDALRVCERRGLLYHELLDRLAEIGKRHGKGAASAELALQVALANEQAQAEEERAEQAYKAAQ